MAHHLNDPAPEGDSLAELTSDFDASIRRLARRTDGLTEELKHARQDRQQQFDEKQRLAERLQSVLSALPAGIVVIDARGCVQEANPAAAQLLGEPLVGLPWRDVVGRAFVVNGVSGSDLLLRDGRRVSLSTRPLNGEPGQLIQLQDVTETRRLHERLDHSQRLAEMGRMAASLAHQIRTPLASALLYVSHLKKAGLPEAKRHAFAEKATARLKDLERLITDILAFSRGEDAGREAVTAGELAADVLEASEQALSDAGIEGSLEVAEDVLLHVNPTLIKTALQNLVRNAIEVMPDGGRIRIRVACPEAGQVQIAVADTGPGIAEAWCERVFEPFETTRSAGTGLGLAVVRAVTRSNGGEAWVESELGRGSTFFLRLPAAEHSGGQGGE